MAAPFYVKSLLYHSTRRTGHSYPHVGLLQRGRVIDAITRHGHLRCHIRRQSADPCMQEGCS